MHITPHLLLSIYATMSPLMDLKKRFSNAILKNRLGHALLFLGGDQAYKGQMAISLSSGLLCENKIIPFGCGHCINCQQILEKRHPKIRFLDTPEIRVDQIRELISAPGNPSWILPQAYLMNKQASNALLKILEEPRKEQFFILIAPNTRSLLSTLVSRCQRIFFQEKQQKSEQAITLPTIPKHLIERFELIERLSKEKSDLNQIFTAWQQNASPKFKEALLKAQNDLKKHVNPQLILECLLCELH